jgi:signal transduction histidine kinase
VDLDPVAAPGAAPLTALGALMRTCVVVVIIAAFAVDMWMLDLDRPRAAYPIVVGVGVAGMAWAARPRWAPVLGASAAVLSLLETVAVAQHGVRFALFTEFVVLPMLFGAVLSGAVLSGTVLSGASRWRRTVAMAIALAAEAIALRADDPAVRAIVGTSMLVLLGAATTAVVYIRLRDQERRTSIERARSDERAELARELHDVVGHHVTGIVVLAQAALFTDVDAASTHTRTLSEIEAAGLETLRSVRRLVGLLRSDPSIAPGADLVDIERIIDGLRISHPFTELVTDDVVRNEWVPADLADTVLRLTQEAATNVRRHGDPRAAVRFTLQRHVGAVELMVENRTLGHPPGDGFGLIGMSERVDALGGSVTAGSAGGGRWVLHASLPITPVHPP